MLKGVKNNLSLLILVLLLLCLLPSNHFPLSGGAVSNFFSRKITLLLTINYILGHGILANMSFFDNWNTWWGMSYIPIKHCIQKKSTKPNHTHYNTGWSNYTCIIVNWIMKTRPHSDLDGWIDHPVLVLLISRLGMSFSNTYWCTTCVYWVGYSNTTRSMQLCIITRMPITRNGTFYTNTSQKELAVGLKMEMVLTYTTMALKKGTFTQKCMT